ncbi:glycosyltransferase family 4 protein [Candidatus Falkowbacteria bacterium]|nr:glycosyltransferase family 4 protein [Candidatus Falkowbacteria bacterium]
MIIGVDIRPLMNRQPSGVSTFLCHLLDNVFKIDRRNQYKLFYNSWHSVADRLPAWDYPNVTWQGFHWPNKLLTLSLALARRPLIDRLIGGCDLFIVPNICFLSLSPACKKLVVVHDLSPVFYPEFFKTKWRLAYWLAGGKKFFRSADALVAVSEHTRHDLITTGAGDARQINVVYPGLSAASASAAALPPAVPKRFILTLGTREPRKNLVSVIQAYEALRRQGEDIGLVIAGGSGWLNQQAHRLIAQSPVRADIAILGYVAPAVRDALYARAAVFVYPSFYEGFGFPPLEAMQARCPVITSFSSATAEVCGDGALLVDPYNVRQLAEAMAAILHDDRLAARLVNKGLDIIKQFDWSESARRLTEVFYRLA